LKVVLDTNVYISAILWRPEASGEEILRLAGLDSFELVISRSIISEIEAILKEKFKWSKRQISETISYIRNIVTVIKPDISISVVKNDPSDNKILECAVAAKANYIVTGDKNHILPIKEYKGIKIVNPAELLRL